MFANVNNDFVSFLNYLAALLAEEETLFCVLLFINSGHHTVKWLKIWNVPATVSVNGPKREVKFLMLHHSNASVHITHFMLLIRRNLL
jgi:hypothetical protein